VWRVSHLFLFIRIPGSRTWCTDLESHASCGNPVTDTAHRARTNDAGVCWAAKTCFMHDCTVGIWLWISGFSTSKKSYKFESLAVNQYAQHHSTQHVTKSLTWHVGGYVKLNFCSFRNAHVRVMINLLWRLPASCLAFWIQMLTSRVVCCHHVLACALQIGCCKETHIRNITDMARILISRYMVVLHINVCMYIQN
jgi:hypothetical protein